MPADQPDEVLGFSPDDHHEAHAFFLADGGGVFVVKLGELPGSLGTNVDPERCRIENQEEDVKFSGMARTATGRFSILKIRAPAASKFANFAGT